MLNSVLIALESRVLTGMQMDRIQMDIADIIFVSRFLFGFGSNTDSVSYVG
jgi:hypothetical protein